MNNYDNKTTRYLDTVKNSKRPKSETSRDKQKKGKKKNARILCHDESQFWTTQKQFWQWVRENVIVKTDDNPLTGRFIDRDEEKNVILANTVLNISRPRHLSEALNQRKYKKKK